MTRTCAHFRSAAFAFAIVGATASVAACSSGEEAPGETGSGASATAIDAQIRADLKAALGAGARCHATDDACRSSVLERIARGDGSDAVLARVMDRVNRLNRADFCEQIDPNAGALFAVGADSAVVSAELAVLFDLKRFAAAVMTSADGLADLQGRAAYETIARANGEFPAVWAGGFAAADAARSSTEGPFVEGTLRWSGAGPIAGTATLAAKQEQTRDAVARISSIDGSTYGLVPTASATSAIVMAKAFESIGATRTGNLVSFASKAKHQPGAAMAIAIAQVAGLDGMGPRAAAMAITFDRAASFPGGVAAYCGKTNTTLATRSFGNVAPRDDEGFDMDLDVSLGTGFGGLEDRTESVPGGETEGLDCSSERPELACAALYGKSTFCSSNGRGSCCRAPITDTRNLKLCTPGPDAGCGYGKVCARAAESGPTANTYVCLGSDTCVAFNRAPVATIDDKKIVIPCEDATPAQQTAYAAALKWARCASSVEACATWIRSPTNAVPRELLDQVQVRLSCTLPNPVWNAATSGIGKGAQAQFFLSKDRYYNLDNGNRMLTLLHELAHATGRLSKDHGPFYEGDPKNEEDWTNVLGTACLLSGAVEAKCGVWQ